MKRKLLFAAMLIAGALGTLKAQMTDVTSTYITNPSFESDGNSAASNANLTITGWTEAQSSAGSYNNTQTRDKDTDNASAFGTKITPADGTYYLFYRHGWNGDSGTTATFTTTTKSVLPAGVYRLEFKYQQSYNEDSSSKTKTRIKLAAKNGETEVASITTDDATKDATFGNDKWNTSWFFFKLDADATIDFVFTMYSGGQKRSDFLLDNIRLLKADNPAEPVANNTTDLYLYNEATGQYLSAGQTWGTHAIVDGTGQPITANLSNGLYTLKTQEFNKYLGGLYMDASAVDWLFLETSVGSGKYYMTQDGYNYMTSNGAGAEVVNVTSPTEASVWTFVSKADRKAALSSATIDVPGNATFMLPDPNFGRNNAAYSNWTWTFPNGENKNNAGNNENFVVECYHKQFTFKHTLAAGTLPAGVYGVTAQGFYRQDGSDNEHLPVFFVNSEKQTFPPRAGSEDSMNKASTSFSAGSYTIEPIYIRIEDVDAFEVGATLATNESLWCIWDNFQLKYYGDVTVAAVKMKASVDAYNAAMGEAQAFTEGSMFASDWTALQTAISSNTLDLNDPSLTEEALTTATANLVAANTAATAAVAGKANYNTAVTTIDGGTNVDLTSLITNPGFETGNTNGWTNSGSITADAQGNKAFDNTQGNYYAERWHVNGTIDINQTIKYLPAGIYKIEAYMYSDTGDAKLYANSEEVAVSTSQKYFAVVEIADKSSIKIGASCTLTGSTWICLDDFKMTYLASSYAEMPYTLATGKMGTDKSAAQASAEATFLADPNKTTYEALLTAIAAAEASKANYDKLKTAIDKAEGVRNANNFVTAAATTTLENEISTATTAWTDVTYTDAQCTSEIATLGSTVSGWHAIADGGVSGAYIASTWSKTHENWFDAPYINTWSTEGDNDGSGFSVPFFEWYVGDTENLPLNTTKTATLTGLDNGYYEVEIWARVQRRTDADFGNNNEITMSVNGGEAVSIMNGEAIDGGYYDGTHTMRIGRFTARGMVTDGTLTISIKTGGSGSNVHWLSWRDITYTKLDVANMTITDAQYATFVAPFDVEIPAEVEAYTVETATGATLNLTPVATTIPANTPVILYKETALSATTFYGKSVDGTPSYGWLTGVYAATPAPDGSYVLQNNDSKVGFYKVNHEVAQPTVGANRCYLTVPTGVKANAFFFNEATGIQNVLEGMQAGEIYDISGRKLGKLQKGVNIVNGKKVLVK